MKFSWEHMLSEQGYILDNNLLRLLSSKLRSGLMKRVAKKHNIKNERAGLPLHLLTSIHEQDNHRCGQPKSMLWGKPWRSKARDFLFKTKTIFPGSLTDRKFPCSTKLFSWFKQLFDLHSLEFCLTAGGEPFVTETSADGQTFVVVK